MPVKFSNALRLDWIKRVEELDADDQVMHLQFEMEAPRLIKPGERLHIRLVVTAIDGDRFEIVAAIDD